MMSYPLMPVIRREARFVGLGFKRRIKRKRQRGGNIVSDLGRSALNIISSGNKKQAIMNELKNLNSTLRQTKTISNFLKNRTGALSKVGTVASMLGYGRRRRRMRGGSFFGKIWSGIKSAGKFATNVIKTPVKLATRIVQAPVKLVMDTVGQPIINYGVSKLLGGRRRRYKRRRIVTRPIRRKRTYVRRTRRRQRGGFLLAPIIAGLVKRAGSTLINKGKDKLINYAKSQGENLLKKITGGRRRRVYRRKRRY